MSAAQQGKLNKIVSILVGSRVEVAGARCITAVGGRGEAAIADLPTQPVVREDDCGSFVVLRDDDSILTIHQPPDNVGKVGAELSDSDLREVYQVSLFHVASLPADIYVCQVCNI